MRAVWIAVVTCVAGCGGSAATAAQAGGTPVPITLKLHQVIRERL